MAQAGASLAHVVRVQYILPDRADFEPCWPLLRAAFASAPPAATMLVAGLADPRMRIEVEVTARLPDEPATALAKVFCFFFPKKKALLP